MEPNRFPSVHIADALESLPILDVGSCERLKAVVHGAALGLCGLMALYNAAAWLKRRQSHLAVNAVIYIAATCWEQRHVAHHVYCKPAPTSVPVQTQRETDSITPRAA